MALIKCKECGKEISDQAESCPNCGYRLKKQNIQNVIVEKTNNIRAGTMLCIIGSTITIGFILIILVMMCIPATQNMSNAKITMDTDNIRVIIGEGTGQTVQRLSTPYTIATVIVDIIVLILGTLKLKGIIKQKHSLIYSCTMLVLSIILSAIMLMNLNCCFILLYVSPICCFVGSIKIIFGSLKERKNEISIQ